MPRLNAVVNHEVYQTYYKRICECETDRIFCCHQMNHLLDVARIAYIKNLEEGLGFDKELINELKKEASNYRELSDYLIPALKEADRLGVTLTAELFKSMNYLQNR